MVDVTISHGFGETERALAAELFWQAFRDKLSKVLSPEERALPFVAEALNPGFALCARDHDGHLLGLAGFKTTEGGLFSAGFGGMARHFGWIGAIWRGALLSLLEREIEDGVLLMDGIFVSEAARGMGVGTRLLEAVAEEAEARGKTEVRLDVIDTNPRAQALYERHGFVPGRVSATGPLRWIFGFGASTEMRKELNR